jgi:hypothetical protein
MTKVASIVQITGQIANDKGCKHCLDYNGKSSKDSSDYKGILALGNGLSSTYFLAH